MVLLLIPMLWMLLMLLWIIVNSSFSIQLPRTSMTFLKKSMMICCYKFFALAWLDIICVILEVF